MKTGSVAAGKTAADRPRFDRQEKGGYVYERPEEKGTDPGKKTKPHGMGVPGSGDAADRMDELLSHDPGVHLIAADRNGY